MVKSCIKTYEIEQDIEFKVTSKDGQLEWVEIKQRGVVIAGSRSNLRWIARSFCEIPNLTEKTLASGLIALWSIINEQPSREVAE